MASFIVQTIFLLLVAAFVIGFVVGTVAALRRWCGGWRLIALLPLLGVIAVVVTIVVDINAEPTAHNLWPFEVLGAVGIAGAALGGLWLVRLIAQQWTSRVEGRTYLVQYFERRRMEYHPENQPPYDILLGLLGREVYTMERGAGGSCPVVSPTLHRTWEVYARDLGCPSAYVGVSEGIGIATEPFEGGAMLWLPRPDGAPAHIFVIVRSPDGSLRWQIYVDSYVEGEPGGTDELPPPGKFPPVRSFGKLWRTVPEVRASLGWGTAPEQADTGTVLQFSGRGGLSWMIHRAAPNRVYILRADGPSIDVPRQ
jgi:hypothetical protein